MGGQRVSVWLVIGMHIKWQNDQNLANVQELKLRSNVDNQRPIMSMNTCKKNGLELVTAIDDWHIDKPLLFP